MKLQRRIDGLNPAPQMAVWLVISLAVYLLMTLALVLTGTPTMGKMGPPWVLLLAMAGYAVSAIRNRREPPLQPVTRYTKQD